MRRLWRDLFAFTALFSLTAVAQPRIEIPSSFNPVGSGARALGFGGSFIAMADDATAASWNPAALMQLRRPELALVYSYLNRSEHNRFATNPEADGKQKVDKGDLNYLALSFPCRQKHCGRNMIFSINYQRLYELNRRWHFNLSKPDTGEVLSFDEYTQYDQQGSLFAIGLAYAIGITSEISLGFTVNFWQDVFNDNGWTQNYHSYREGLIGGVPFEEYYDGSIGYDFSGVNYNLGLVWDVYQKNEQKLTLAAVYKSAFAAQISRHDVNDGIRYTYLSQLYPQFDDLIEPREPVDAHRSFSQTMPKSVGLGVAFQWNDAVTTSIDIYRTDWQRFAIEGDGGARSSPLSGKLLTEVEIQDTTQVRMGLEYRLISQKKFGHNYIVPLRAGAFIDPAPADGKPDDTYGLSIGTGIAFRTMVFDVAYQKRWGENLGQFALPHLGFSQRLDEHTLYASMFVRFE